MLAPFYRHKDMLGNSCLSVRVIAANVGDPIKKVPWTTGGRDVAATPRGTAARGQPYRNYCVSHEKGWGAYPENWNGHHARQNDDRIGRDSDYLSPNNDECIRSTKTKKGQGNDTKGGVRNDSREHAELGAANRAGVRASWWSSWSSHNQAPQMTAQCGSTVEMRMT